MGQYFKFFNIDKRQGFYCGKFGEMFSEGNSRFTSKLLGGSEIKSPIDPLQGHPYVQAEKIDIQKFGLCDLPVELHIAIFEEIQDPTDVFALCLCSIHFWMVGVHLLGELYIADSLRDDWAGDRIICLGDYADDLPEGMLTDAELKECEFDHLEAEDSDEEDVLFFDAFNDVFGYQAPESVFESESMRKQCPLHRYYSPLYKFDFWPWIRCVDRSSRSYGTELANSDSPRVLRNLSKKVYVRADTLALKPEHIGPAPWTIKRMSFDRLVALRTAWSSDSSMSLQYAHDHDLHRGVWAGDRFDIVDLQQIEEGWTDVTAEAKKELEEIWKAELGDHWEAV